MSLWKWGARALCQQNSHPLQVLPTHLFPIEILESVIKTNTQPTSQTFSLQYCRRHLGSLLHLVCRSFPVVVSSVRPWFSCWSESWGVWLGWASIGAENLAGHWNRSYQSASQSIHTEAAFKKHQRPWLKGGIRLWMERDLIHGWSSSSGSPLTPSWAY